MLIVCCSKLGNDFESFKREFIEQTMIIHSSIYRTSDGLPLCASTDISSKQEVRECLKFAKLISKRLPTLDDKCVLNLIGYNIHVVSSAVTAYVVLTDDAYPPVLAYSFIRELQSDFLIQNTPSDVQSARRPYAFIDYEPHLQKIRVRYNSPRSLSTRLSLQDLTLELKLRPPQILHEADLGIGIDTKIGNGNSISPISVPVPGGKTTSVGCQGYIAIFGSIVCAVINIVRGMAIINHGHYDAFEDSGAYYYGTVFLGAALVHLFQIYLLNFYVRRRAVWSIVSFMTICLTTVLLQRFRAVTQSLFHLGAGLGSMYTVFVQARAQKFHEHIV